MVGQLIVNVAITVPGQPLPSVTVTVIGKLPVCVGVPLSVPFVDSVIPVGSVLVVVYIFVPSPPLDVKLWL
jgi:hypothetical protein